MTILIYELIIIGKEQYEFQNNMWQVKKIEQTDGKKIKQHRRWNIIRVRLSPAVLEIGGHGSFTIEKKSKVLFKSKNM